MEHMAAKLNMDPLEFRIKNFFKEGDMLLFGHPFKGHNPLPDLITDLGKSAKLDQRKADIKTFNQNNTWKKRGISVVPVNYTAHLPGPMPSYCHISVYEGDGSISVSHGGIEMGQGMYLCINLSQAISIFARLSLSRES